MRLGTQQEAEEERDGKGVQIESIWIPKERAKSVEKKSDRKDVRSHGLPREKDEGKKENDDQAQGTQRQSSFQACNKKAEKTKKKNKEEKERKEEEKEFCPSL